MSDKTDFRDDMDDDLAVACNNCDWFGKMSEVKPISDIRSRILPGEIVPAGECPKCSALASLSDRSIPFILRDHAEQPNGELDVTIKLSNGNIELYPKDYGNHANDPGHGCPLFIEFYDGHLRALAWADINQEDPTHTIDLEGARETNRKEG